MKTIEAILTFIQSAAILTLTQLLSILGLLFVFGFVLYFLAGSSRRLYVKSGAAWLDVVFTGWIGTPVHESSHALFCIIFRHKIKKIRFFNPKPRDGSLGFVIHSYDSKSLWQRTGKFFIGVGPLLIGPLIIFLLMKLLLPQAGHVFDELKVSGTALHSSKINQLLPALQALLISVKKLLMALLSPENFNKWQFWLFLYLTISIASHMQLSPSDLKGALSGFITIVLMVFLVNMLILLLAPFITSLLPDSFLKYFYAGHYAGLIGIVTGSMVAVFTYSVLISAIHLLMAWLLISSYTLTRGKGLINPFW